MAKHRLSVVLSQGQSKHPAKRALEEAIVAALIMEPGIEMAVLPHLYDLDAQHPGRLHLGAVRGDLVVLSWLYERAAFWALDRGGVKGQPGQIVLKAPVDRDEDEDLPAEEPKGIGSLDAPIDRYIYCLDLRDSDQAATFVEEIRRIHAESAARAAAAAPRAWVWRA